MKHRFLMSGISLYVATLVGACGSAEVGADPTFEPNTPAAPPRAGIAAGQPWAHNTGPTNESILSPANAPSGTIEQDGAIYENFIDTGRITIEADNVTLRNFKLDANGNDYGIHVRGSATGAVVEDGEIEDAESAVVFDEGDNSTFRRLHLHDSQSDTFKTHGDGTLVEGCFIEKIGKGAGSHADGWQNQAVSASNQTYRGNNCWIPYPGTPNYSVGTSNACFIFNDAGSYDNIVIDGNWLNGGNFTIYCAQGEPIEITNNLFGRENRDHPDASHGDCSEPCDGASNIRNECGSAVWSNNRWEDTGELIP